jgi:oxygen-independent coproporphyrinogen III oxidase
LSVYALTLEEGTPLYKANPVLPDEDKQYEILKEVWAYLEDEGFEHYEVSNFAKNGKKGLHNCRYWAYLPYLGLGPGAASTAQKDGKEVRYCVEKSVYKYGKGEKFTGCEAEFLSREEAIEELVMMGLRYKGGLDLGRLVRDFGVMQALDLGLTGCEVENFVREGDFLVPTDEGLMIADYAARKVIEILMKI